MTLDWDLLRLFLAVARSGSLSAAARRLDLSQPTLGRRMGELEDALAATLFVRTRDGYRMTETGDWLLQHAEAMEHAVATIRSGIVQAGSGPHGIVRVAAGEWASHFLARNLHRVVGAQAGVGIELLTSLSYVSLNRQEAHLAVRNELPDAKELVQQKLGTTVFAVYAHRDYLAATGITAANCFSNGRWVSFDADHEHLRTARWVLERTGGRPFAVRCDSSRAILDAVLGRGGLGVIPRFVGDLEPELVRVFDVAFRSDLFLVGHPDTRRLPHVDVVWRGLVALYRSMRDELGAGAAEAGDVRP